MATTDFRLPTSVERVTDVTRIGRCIGCHRTRRLTWAHVARTPSGKAVSSVPLCESCGVIVYNRGLDFDEGA